MAVGSVHVAIADVNPGEAVTVGPKGQLEINGAVVSEETAAIKV